MPRIGGGLIAPPAPTLPREDTTSRTPPRLGQHRLSMAPTRPGGPSADQGSLWPRQRLFGHASVALATPAALRARFVGYFRRSRGQRVRGVAKEAGRDPPAEAGGAAVTSVTKPPTPAGGAAPVSETTIRYSRHADPRSPIGPLNRRGQQQLDLGRGPVSWWAH